MQMDLINEEREKNLIFYNENEDMIKSLYVGKYIVIAGQEIKAIGDSLEEVESVAYEYNHRFVFLVEKESNGDRTVRVPMEAIRSPTGAEESKIAGPNEVRIKFRDKDEVHFDSEVWESPEYKRGIMIIKRRPKND